VRLGAAVLVISPDGAAPNGATGLAIGPADPLLSPAVAIVPVQLLAWRLARAAGRAPGAYVHAAKVTSRE
jgi:glucosamine 6-phosphate synthetase-like amidotransferase/phosphosugar isomerase protein